MNGIPHPARAVQLPTCALFVGAAAASRHRIEASLTRRRLQNGEHLWWAGDAVEHITIVERGIIQIVRTQGGGATSVLGIFGPGDPVGLAVALDDRPVVYPADAMVVSPEADVARIPARDVRGVIAEDHELAAAARRGLIDHSRILLAKTAVVGAGSVAARLATLFVQLADRFGAKAPGGVRVVVPVPLTRSTLAGLAEVRVETVIRALGGWRQAGIVSTTKAGFDIDYAALVAISAAG